MATSVYFLVLVHTDAAIPVRFPYRIAIALCSAVCCRCQWKVNNTPKASHKHSAFA